ncbi:hypothetical protein UT300019_18240 [Clostridium sp. CTA-19]
MQNKSPENIIGPDINEYRGNIDYKLLATQTPYVYARASGSGTGRFRVDKKFIEYVNGLKSVGILSGGYHYAVPSYDLTTADSQCDDFIKLLQQAYGDGKYGELFPVIDIETPIDKSISTDALLDWVDRFRKRFEKKTRRVLMLYTGAFFIDLYNNFNHSKKGYILADMPLWIAMYPEIPGNPLYPKDQGGWTRWTIWQFTENGNMKGINPPVDLNYGPKHLDYLTQPRVVKNLKAYAGKNNIYVTWSRNTDKDLNGYNLFLNSEYVATVGRDSVEFNIKLDKPFNPNAKYEVSIEAFDLGGDFSPSRAKVIVSNTREDLENLNSFNHNILQNKDYSIGKYSSSQKPGYFSPRIKENTMVYYDEDDDLYYYPVKISHPYEYESTMSRGDEDEVLFKYNLDENNMVDDLNIEKSNMNDSSEYENYDNSAPDYSQIQRNLDNEYSYKNHIYNEDIEDKHNLSEYCPEKDLSNLTTDYNKLQWELDEEYANKYDYKDDKEFYSNYKENYKFDGHYDDKEYRNLDSKSDYNKVHQELDKEYAKECSYKIKNECDDLPRRKNVYEEYDDLYDYKWLSNKEKNRPMKKNINEVEDSQYKYWYEDTSSDKSRVKTKSKNKSKDKHNKKKHKNHR